MKKKREFRHREFIFRQISRFILGQPSNNIRNGLEAASMVMVEVEVMGVVRVEALIEVLLLRNQSKQARNMK